MINFANVTDIAITQGNVVKIQETNGGRVLWEKAEKLNPKWIKVEFVQVLGNADTSSMGTGFTGIAPDYSWGDAQDKPLKLNSTLRYYLRASASGGRNPTTGLDLYGKTSYGILLATNYSPRNYILIKNNIRFSTGESLSNNITYIYALSDNGMCIYYLQEGVYYINRTLQPNSFGGVNIRLQTKAPVNDTDVYITYSPERAEYLVTGIKGGTFTLPENFTSSTSITQKTGNLGKSLWVKEHTKYYAIKGTDRYVQSSSDGYTWVSSQALSSGNISGIAYMNSKGLLCAISSDKGKLATSSDGMTWNERDVPFTNALACAYSPTYDALCVVDNKKAYLSKDFNNWTEAELPSGTTVNFREIKHLTDGIFVGYKYTDAYIWLLVLE